MKLALIAAQSLNHIIGSGLDIPWHAKGEQKLFKEITQGSTLIMGRKTFDSIGRPLPGRETIIVTRQQNYQIPGCHVARGLEAAVTLAMTLNKPCFIAGGGEIYSAALNTLQVDEIHLTTIQIEVEGDVYFPSFDREQFQVIEEKHFETNLAYVYQKFVRIA